MGPYIHRPSGDHFCELLKPVTTLTSSVLGFPSSSSRNLKSAASWLPNPSLCLRLLHCVITLLSETVMEVMVKKYLQKFRKIRDEMNRWDELQSRLISQFRDASSIIERLPVVLTPTRSSFYTLSNFFSFFFLYGMLNFGCHCLRSGASRP